MLTVSGVCMCPSCEEGSQRIYRMVRSCSNCHSKPILMLYRGGDKAHPLTCPVCEGRDSVYPQRLATEDEIPAADTMTVDAVEGVMP